MRGAARLLSRGLVVLLLFTACESTYYGRLDEFIVGRVSAYGGNPAKEESIAPLIGRWKASTDEFGCVIETRDVGIEALEKFVSGAYGLPSRRTLVSDGSVQYVVSARTAGVAIWFRAMTNRAVRITINKPMHFSKEGASQ